MSESVFDASVVIMSNDGQLDSSKLAAAQVGITLLKEFIGSNRNLRYNPKLLLEYEAHTLRRSDLIVVFYRILTSARGIKVKSNQLRAPQNATAHECNWPGHDRHLIAAAIDGRNPVIYVSESRLGNCAAAIRRRFGITVTHLNMQA